MDIKAGDAMQAPPAPLHTTRNTGTTTLSFLEIEKPDGSSSMKGYVVQVMKKVQGRWLILEAHPKLLQNLYG